MSLSDDDKQRFAELHRRQDYRSCLTLLSTSLAEATFQRCLLSTRDEHEADDLVSEIYLRVFEKLGQLRDPYAVAGWYWRIVDRECSRRHRSLFKRFLGSRAEAASLHHAPAPEDDAEQKAIAARVQEYMRSLDVLDRVILDNVFHRRRKLPEVSEFLSTELTYEATKKRYQRAHKRLKEIIAGDKT